MAEFSDKVPQAGKKYEMLEIHNGQVKERRVAVARKVVAGCRQYIFEYLDDNGPMTAHIAPACYPVHRWYTGPNNTGEIISIVLPVQEGGANG